MSKLKFDLKATARKWMPTAMAKILTLTLGLAIVFVPRLIAACPVERPFIFIEQIFRVAYFLYFFSIKYILNFWFIN